MIPTFPWWGTRRRLFIYLWLASVEHLKGSQSQGGQQQRAMPEPACPMPSSCTAPSVGLLETQQHGEPPALLGFAGGWHRAGKTHVPLSLLSARKEINSLAKNKVQKTYGRCLFVRQIISARFFFFFQTLCLSHQSACVTLSWLLPLVHAVLVFPDRGH